MAITFTEDQEIEEIINLFIGNSERIMRQKFTNNEKNEIKINPKQFLTSTIKSFMPFKKSSLEFNLEAIGMKEMLDVFYRCDYYQKKWSNYNLELNDLGNFKVIK